MSRSLGNRRINRDALGVISYDLQLDSFLESGRPISLDAARELFANGGSEWTLGAYAKITLEIRDYPLVYLVTE